MARKSEWPLHWLAGKTLTCHGCGGEILRDDTFTKYPDRTDYCIRCRPIVWDDESFPAWWKPYFDAQLARLGMSAESSTLANREENNAASD